MQIFEILKLKSLILSNQLKTSRTDERPGERSRIRQEDDQLGLLAVVMSIADLYDMAVLLLPSR